MVDFKMGEKIIEFDGTYWHSFSEIQKKDEEKRKILKDKGYEILEIKEEDYETNSLHTIQKCCDFLLNQT